MVAMRLILRNIFKICLILTVLIGCATTQKIKETDPTKLLRQGNSFFEKGQYDQSIAYFNKAVEIDPKDAEAYNNRGVAYDNKGQYDKAIADCTKAIEINPEYELPYNNRCCVYYKRGRYDNAVADCARAIKINPSYAAAYKNRGMAYFYKREYEKAWDDVYKAQNLGYNVNPEFINALRQASGRHE
jgi:tetratricopeptide (TPR) repeat protein